MNKLAKTRLKSLKKQIKNKRKCLMNKCCTKNKKNNKKKK